MPEIFRPCVEEPAFCERDGTPRATVCFWRERSDVAWRSGAVEIPSQDREDADGSEWLFDVPVDGRPEAYQRFAKHYYEVAVDLKAVRHVHALRPLSQDVVSSPNPDVSPGELAEDTAQIDYVDHRSAC